MECDIASVGLQISRTYEQGQVVNFCSLLCSILRSEIATSCIYLYWRRRDHDGMVQHEGYRIDELQTI